MHLRFDSPVSLLAPKPYPRGSVLHLYDLIDVGNKCSLVPKASTFLGGTKDSHRAWYLKSGDQLTSLSDSKDGRVSLRFTGDFVSAVSLWHKRAVKINYTRSVDSLPSLVV